MLEPSASGLASSGNDSPSSAKPAPSTTAPRGTGTPAAATSSFADLLVERRGERQRVAAGVRHAEQLADGGRVRLARASAGALAEVEDELRRVVHERRDEPPPAAEQAHLVARPAQRVGDRGDGQLGRLVLLEQVIRRAVRKLVVGAQVKRDPDPQRGAHAVASASRAASSAHQRCPASGSAWIGS